MLDVIIGWHTWISLLSPCGYRVAKYARKYIRRYMHKKTKRRDGAAVKTELPDDLSWPTSWFLIAVTVLYPSGKIIWSCAMKIGIGDNNHFCNSTIQTGKTVLGADTQCLHESLHTCYSKWLEDHIQTLLDNLPLGMKMHRWYSCVFVVQACAMLCADGILFTDQYWPLVWMQWHLKRRR